jgi:hypothetical protein
MADGVNTRQILERLNLITLSPILKMKTVNTICTVTLLATILKPPHSCRLLPQKFDPLHSPLPSALLLNRAEIVDACMGIFLKALERGVWFWVKMYDYGSIRA